MYPDEHSRSAQLYRRARKVLPGGNTRTSVFFKPYPIYAAWGAGCRITDADGVERIDFVNNYTSLIHGHAHPRIVEVVGKQLALGSCFSAPTESEILLAELLCDRVRSIERIRFTNSGTEGVMMAIKAARGYTGRAKIAKCEGAYHGSYDYAEMSLGVGPETWGDADAPNSVPPSEGTPPSVRDDVVIIPFNDAARAETILTPHAGELAAILIDPMPNRCGLVPGTPTFFTFLREFTRQHGILLIFDEVISFRLGYRGGQAEFGVEPDLTAMGKMIGCGFPVGAVAGSAEVMAVFDPSAGAPPVPHAGTFNANPVTMAAGLTAMEMMTPEAFDRINQLGERARSGLRGAFGDAGVTGTIAGKGSLFRIYMAEKTGSDYRTLRLSTEESDRITRLHRYLLNHGFLLSFYGLGNISTAHTETEVDRLVEAVSDGLYALKEEGLAAA